MGRSHGSVKAELLEQLPHPRSFSLPTLVWAYTTCFAASRALRSSSFSSRSSEYSRKGQKSQHRDERDAS